MIAKVLIGVILCFGVLRADKEDTLVEIEYKSTIGDTISGLINNALECVKIFLQNGNSTIGIPTLDPLEIRGPLDFGLNFNIISGDLSLSNLNGFGISNFNATVNVTSASILRYNVEVQLIFENIEVTTDYSLDSRFLVSDFYGDGAVSLELKNLVVDVGISIYVLGSPTLRDPAVNLSLENLSLSVSGLFNNDRMSDLISRQLEATLSALIEEQQNVISYYAESIIQSLVQNITLADLTSGSSSILNC